MAGNMKALFVGVALLAAAGQVQAEASAEIQAKYGKSCAMCHASGAAGAPKTGDVAAWEPRIAKGMEALLQSVNNGLNAMPPKGMCYDCSDEDYSALITHMATAK